MVYSTAVFVWGDFGSLWLTRQPYRPIELRRDDRLYLRACSADFQPGGCGDNTWICYYCCRATLAVSETDLEIQKTPRQVAECFFVSTYLTLSTMVLKTAGSEPARSESILRLSAIFLSDNLAMKSE